MAKARKTYDAKHRAPDEPGDYVTSRGEPRRRPSPRHDGDTPKRAAKKAAPVSATPVTAPIHRPAPPARRGPRPESHRSRVAREEATEYARRAAIRSGGSKPSVVGRAGAGGLAGAASGAALGSVVPGVGTAVGAAVGGGVGTVGGAVGGARAKKAYKAAMRTNGAARRAIVAEFAVCMVIATLSPLTDKRKNEKPGAFMKRMSAIMGLFLILGLVAAMGRTASKVSAGLGGLVTVGLVVSERDLFLRLAGVFGSSNDRPAAGTGPGDAGEDVGTIGGGVLGDVQVGG